LHGTGWARILCAMEKDIGREGTSSSQRFQKGRDPLSMGNTSRGAGEVQFSSSITCASKC
jgi:hypothetical protein